MAWILVQDRRLHAAEAGPWHQAQILGQHLVSILVRGKRVRLTAGPVQGEHELLGEALVQRVGGHEALDLTGQRGVTAEREVGIDPPFQGPHPHGFQPGHLGPGERFVAALTEHGPAYQNQRVAQRRRGAGEPPLLHGGLGHGKHSFEAIGVDLTVECAHLVPGRLTADVLAARQRARLRQGRHGAGRCGRAACSWRSMAGHAARARR